MRDLLLCAAAYAGMWILGVVIVLLAPVVVAGWMLNKIWRQI